LGEKGDIWFMKQYPTKEKVQNIMSVMAGVSAGFLLVFLLNLFLLLVMASSSRDSISPENNGLFKIFALAIIFVSCLAAGFITAKISTRSTFIHVLLTGIVLLLIMLGIADFDWKGLSTVDWLGLLLTIPCTLLGGYIVTRKLNSEIGN
jgi:putative membrane protein (TIGR04086 family)